MIWRYAARILRQPGFRKEKKHEVANRMRAEKRRKTLKPNANLRPIVLIGGWPLWIHHASDFPRRDAKRGSEKRRSHKNRIKNEKKKEYEILRKDIVLVAYEQGRLWGFETRLFGSDPTASKPCAVKCLSFDRRLYSLHAIARGFDVKRSRTVRTRVVFQTITQSRPRSVGNRSNGVAGSIFRDLTTELKERECQLLRFERKGKKKTVGI